MAQVIHNGFALCHKWDVPQFFRKCFIFVDINHCNPTNLKQIIAMIFDILPYLRKTRPVCQNNDRILFSQTQIPQHMTFPQNSYSITDYSIKYGCQKQCNTRKIPRIFHKKKIKHGKQNYQTHLPHRCRQFYKQSTFEYILTCI